MRTANCGCDFNGRPQMQNLSFSETVSNMFHVVVASLFGLISVAAALHAVIALA